MDSENSLDLRQWVDIVLQKVLSGLLSGGDNESDGPGDLKTGWVADTRAKETWHYQC